MGSRSHPYYQGTLGQLPECCRASWLMDPDPISRTLSNGFPGTGNFASGAERARFWPGAPVMS